MRPGPPSTSATLGNSRPREIVRLLYRQVCRLTRYSADSQNVTCDADVEDAIENERVILEEDAKGAAADASSPPRTRWAHMSEQKEANLVASTNSNESERELKRKARDAR